MQNSTAKHNILIIEDDADINKLLSIILTKADYDVVQAFSGSEAQLRLEMETPDLIMLDLMLPGMSGEALIEHIRNDKKMDMPIIVLSAKAALENKVETLTNGADDYITKPFEPEEVLVRVKAALRRYNNPAGSSGVNNGSENSNGSTGNGETYVYKKLCVFNASRSATVNEEEITLTNHEFDILKLLMSQPQQVFSRERIYEIVWESGYYGEDNTVNVHVSNIRKKIAEKDPDEEYIKTVWGIGFKMA